MLGAELVLCRGGLRHGRGIHRARRRERTYKKDLRGMELRQVAELSKSWCFQEATLGIVSLKAE